jgi:Xaa-Pro aminopeptidase
VKADIDRLMGEHGLDALLVLGPGQNNPFMTYMVGSAHLTEALVVKKAGAAPVLGHRSMERDEAARSGLDLVSLEFPDRDKALADASGDPRLAKATLWAEILKSMDVSGRVAVYGRLDLASSFPLLMQLQELVSGVEWAAEPDDAGVLYRARITKDDDELGHIRHMGQVTTEVAGEVAEFLGAQRAAGGHLVDSAGEAITIGQLKNLIRRLVAERGGECPSGLILAAGRDAAVPHSTGNDSQPVPIAQTIILDLYPAEAGGGYYYDFTRTWCLGRPSPGIQALFEDVLNTYDTMLPSFAVGSQTSTYQIRACEQFESQGHPTLLSDPGTVAGYVHGLGHGLGLAVHEPPWFRNQGDGSLALEPGMVFTFEPGLYYPDQGMGIRLEDTLVVEPNGRIHSMVDFPKDLVIPVSGT